MSERFSTLFSIVAGLFGAVGIALSAMAAHVGDDRYLAIAAAMLLFHAAALLGLSQSTPARLRLAPLSALLITIGTLLFAGDLSARSFLGDRLFPMAAPSGGIALIAGWLSIAAGAAVAAVRRRG
ncbi:DUF423 domain-containing protein [Mangrovicella endophytica]|uniref:DUF423 domain-containing protein n=1 Tax=Mangrovicella endophytica TaxID=2066697 RepID=UPI000C9E769D|nr:DUF423 domain-containing protein [Mangrovicella endophytica]